ncbi:hypothetical protein AMJ86_01185 [bacterium SM23_57]|nr:MAG: hypothetical protein AMJ86_01185 [bacterium SM23_57]
MMWHFEKKMMIAMLVVLLATLGTGWADLTDGLVGHWAFEEGQGTVAHDSSGNDNHGSLAPEAAAFSDADPMVGDYAIILSGTHATVDVGYVEVADSNSLDVGEGDFTMALWVKRDDDLDRDDLITKKDTENDFSVFVAGDNLLTLFTKVGQERITLTSEDSVPAGQWVHLAVIREAGLCYLYLNGSISGWGENALNFNSTGVMRLGSNRRPSDQAAMNPLEGMLDDVVIYNWALSDAELNLLKNNPGINYVLIDDMESYSNDEGSRIYEGWADGEEDPNNGGSLVGADPGANDYSPETGIVHFGAQSLPIHYWNTNGVAFSEATHAIPENLQDWTLHGVTTLSLYFHGNASNSGQLYLKINDAKIDYAGYGDSLQREHWILINVPLDPNTVATDLTAVKSLTVGIEGADATGKVLIDDVGLYVDPPMVELEIPVVDANKPVIDGEVDAVWANADILKANRIRRNPQNVDPDVDADCSGTLQALWDNEYLYVLVNVTDDILIQDSDYATAWHDDRIEVFIDADNSKTADIQGDKINDFQYCFSWNPEVHPPLEWYFRLDDAKDALAGVEQAVVITDEGYRIEIKFPWSTLLGSTPTVGDRIGIGLALSDDDDGDAVDAQIAGWVLGFASNPHIPKLWGTARLLGQ